MNARRNILTIDGGGIRGLVAAVWLARLEHELKSPLYRCFDIVAGTSTGSILAAAVALGMPPEHIVELYLEKGRTVFPGRLSRWKSRLMRLPYCGLSAPKYDGRGLESALKESLGEQTQLGAAKTQLLVTAYDVRRRVPVIFNSRDAQHVQKPLWEICRASSSAPTYFPAYKFRFQAVHPLVDGGVVANNPTAVAIAEGIRQSGNRQHCLDDFLVASFGTGHCTREITIRQSQTWGAVQWGLPMLDVMFDASSAIVDGIARHLVPEENYFRFQVELKRGADSMDDASEGNVNNLVSVAESFLNGAEGSRKLRLLVSKLRERTDEPSIEIEEES